MPKPYGMRGGYRAVFTEAAIESSWTARWDGSPTTTLTEYTGHGSREVDLPAGSEPPSRSGHQRGHGLQLQRRA